MKSNLMTIAAVFAVVGNCAHADQIIFAPTGTTLALGQAKLEAAVSSVDSDQQYYWLNVGVPRLELQGIRVQNKSGMHDDGFGAELSVLPDTIVTPAIGIGARDISNSTSLGRAFYLVVSKNLPAVSKLNLPVNSVKLTGGLGTNSLNGFFGGVELGFTKSVSGAAEYDGKRFNAYLAYRPIQPVQLKAYWINGDFYYGGRLSIGL